MLQRTRTSHTYSRARTTAVLLLTLGLGLMPSDAAAQLNFDNVQFWHQDSPDILGMSEEGDSFGAALASGDFNNDGYPDAAIGVAGENIGDIEQAGTVHVLYSGPNGLSEQGNQLWSRDTPNVLGDPEAFDNFGAALTSGDFDGDNYDDLAIGTPGAIVDGKTGAGAVHILYGGPDGLAAADNQLFTQDTPGLLGEAEPGDIFGFALAAGDFNRDGFADLAIGVEGEDINPDNAGAVSVVYGSGTGLAVEGNQFWHEDSPDIEGTAALDDALGTSLAVGDFDNDGFDDLAAGAPGVIAGNPVAGAVNVIYGSQGGLASAGNQQWVQGEGGLLDTAEDGDFFGWRLAAGDFNGDGFDDLAASADGESLGKFGEAGQVSVIYGAAGGLSAIGNQVWHQNSAGIDDQAEPGDFFGTGSLTAGDLDNDGFDDLAVGSPLEDLESAKGMTGTVFEFAGIVNVIYGRAQGLTATGDQRSFKFDDAEGGELLGTSLVAADFNLDGFDDLAAGARRSAAEAEGVPAGTVVVVPGKAPPNLVEDLERQLRALKALQQLLSLLAF